MADAPGAIAELYYVIADADCATARRVVMERGLKEKVRFRNLFYDEVRVDLEAHHAAAGRAGEARLPALWDGALLHEGLGDVLTALGRIG
jgi:hypothetical protein